jgi:hypothetical protein
VPVSRSARLDPRTEREVLLAVAGGLALAGRRQAQEAVPPVPAEAADSVQEDVRYLKERSSR